MIQIFLKTSAISAADWVRAYRQIVAIAEGFPLKLVRIESYNGWSPELDKEHFDLVAGAGTPEEHLSFYGDWMSYTSKFTVRFYKDWELQQKKGMSGKEPDPSKAVAWFPPKKFRNDGSLPDANGRILGEHGYFSSEGALYRYALLAIGAMLENLLPGRAFMIAHEADFETLEKVTEWLRGHFKESFEMPLYADRFRLLASLEQEYADKKHLVGRMDQLYRKEFKRNMEFAIEHIGYEPSFAYYAETLTDASFGTFGFEDMLNPWIAASADLESTLNLVAESKRILEKQRTKGSLEKAAEYDLTYILKKLLGNFVLWTPEQRELLEHFYTNRRALESGSEDLWGSILRMSGYRVNICPYHATPQELFEAFMFHDPKNGAVFKQIIDDWIAKNANRFDELKLKMEDALSGATPGHGEGQENGDEDETEEAESAEFEAAADDFLQSYPEHEHFFIAKAIMANPALLDTGKAFEKLRNALADISGKPENLVSIKEMMDEPKSLKIEHMRYRIKRLPMSVSPMFERWLDDETDDSVLFHLRLLISMKIYDRSLAYARHLMLYDKSQWDKWRKEGEYSPVDSQKNHEL